jgi:hypothetical protein
VIELTEKQSQALQSSAESPPTLFDPLTKTTYVLIHQDVYQRLRGVLDDTVWTTAETLDQIMGEDDVLDPTLQFYQQKYGGKS